uniref:Uncharacterized protein n=1 Tax=Romanomermis culicivorax TaxID=13658 RepID=A0A915KT13_ROMCU
MDQTGIQEQEDDFSMNELDQEAHSVNHGAGLLKADTIPNTPSPKKSFVFGLGACVNISILQAFYEKLTIGILMAGPNRNFECQELIGQMKQQSEGVEQQPKCFNSHLNVKLPSRSAFQALMREKSPTIDFSRMQSPISNRRCSRDSLINETVFRSFSNLMGKPPCWTMVP